MGFQVKGCEMEMLTYVVAGVICGASITMYLLERIIVKGQEEMLNLYREQIKLLNERYGLLLAKHQNSEGVEE